MMGQNRSVANGERFSWTTMARRSRPIPVSMFFRGRDFKEPSFWRSNWVNTRFQISM